MTRELSKETIIAWRTFSASEAFRDGVSFLREIHAPSVSGKTAAELLEMSLKWGGYQEALNDLTSVLTYVETKQQSLDEPPLQA